MRRLDLDAAPASASYPASKLLVMLVASELSCRTKAASVSIADPGFVRTNLGRHATGVFALMLRLTRAFQDDPDHAAATSVWLATAPDATARNGGYFAKSAPASVSGLARDGKLAQRAYDQAVDLLDGWI